jgi:hypothetical protein
MNIFVRVGLLALAAGLLVRLFTHASYSEFVAGFLIGLSIVLIIFGLVGRSQIWGAESN